MLCHKLLISMTILCSSTLFSQAAVGQTVATSPSERIPTSCTFSKSARVVGLLRDIPEVAAEFKRLNLVMADVGGKFIPFDVEDEASKGLPHRQFVRAYVFDDRVVAWYYRGGFVTSFHAVELREQRQNDEAAPVLRLTGRSLGGPLCFATQALLDGVIGGNGW